MVDLRLDEIAEKVRGQILQGSPSRIFHKFGIDSRLSQPGELFFAIVARRNGHDFIPDAAARGAHGAVISQDIRLPHPGFALIRVENTVEALQILARAVLEQYPVRVIGITGSIGKTTTKEFTAGLLSHRYRVLRSEGNWNNYLGLALSLLKLTPQHQVAVLEMAASAPGEIRGLTRIAPPDISVITNINPVHLEFFHTLERIARAKKEILQGTKKGGTAVLNADDPLVQKIASGWKGEKITFGLSRRTDIQASSIQKMGTRGIRFELRMGSQKGKVLFPIPYEDYLYNLLAAVGASHALSLPFETIIREIPRLRLFQNRGVLISLSDNIKLVDDSYNSNPKALASILKSLASFPAKRKIAVLGDMLELGQEERKFHTRAGHQAAENGWDVLVTIGPLSLATAEGAGAAGMPRDQIYSFVTSEEAADKILSLVQEGDLILVKGSHGVSTEKIVDRLKEHFQEN